jgi:muconate cycloisomerase
MQEVHRGVFQPILSQELSHWQGPQSPLPTGGSLAAACDVAMHDALGHYHQQPVWQLLGTRHHQKLELLWPTSSGTASDDLAVIQPKLSEGFRTFMLKMGDKPILEELGRLKQVFAALPKDAHLMTDANQGWTREEATEFFQNAQDLPLVLVEQPLVANDLEGLSSLRQYGIPISVDESLQNPENAREIIDKAAADIFSIKISKNGGLLRGLEIGKAVEADNKQVMMNSMIELGITQSASLHLGTVLPNLVSFGHAYMSTLRMSDDVTDFSSWIQAGTVRLPEAPGLGVKVSEEKIQQYLEDEYHAHL